MLPAASLGRFAAVRLGPTPFGRCLAASVRPGPSNWLVARAATFATFPKATPLRTTPTTTMDPAKTKALIEADWDGHIVDKLVEYVAIPNQSPMFDPEWETNGLQEKAMDLIVDWVKGQQKEVKGLKYKLLTEKGRTPFLLVTVEPTEEKCSETVLMYGHMDKQPPLTDDWDEGLGPYTPVIRDGKLYGRGGADDGYSIFAAIAAIKAVQAQGGKHARIVITIEACEESGSTDLMYWLVKCAKDVGQPSLVICLDSGAGDYERLWLTASLRGMAAFDLRVKILNEGVHSGMASGVVPSTFRIIRQLLDRIEDKETGRVLVEEAHCEIPENFYGYAEQCAKIWGDEGVWKGAFPFVAGSEPMAQDNKERLLNLWWRPTVSYVGLDGMPASKSAGNVLRSYTNLRVSVRLPPAVNPNIAAAAFKRILEKDPPHGAEVSVTVCGMGQGFDAPPVADWLQRSLETSSKAYYNGKTVEFMGVGGSIPFMYMLGEMFPQTQFMVVGVLGPQSNAHGPNEFLHIPYAKQLTCCVAHALHDHAVAFADEEE